MRLDTVTVRTKEKLPRLQPRRVFSRARASRRRLHRAFLPGLEGLRQGSGAFVAAASDDYNACWIRDQLYATLPYYYLGNVKAFRKGIHVIFDILDKSRDKIEEAICTQPRSGADFIHAKFDSETFEEITTDWGHHQIDALGLFLFIVGFAHEKGIAVIRNHRDKEMIQLLVGYLTSVRYFEQPDNGMWEEDLELHSSSIGAAVAGLSKIRRSGLAVVPQSLITLGLKSLDSILPNESPDREVDLAQLSLVWPYTIVSREIGDIIISRVKEKLVQRFGVNRYLGDNYYRSDSGISAEWTMGFFWLSIIASEKGECDEARYWFDRGKNTMTPDNHLPELYQNGVPNGNTPLAWSHALAIIAAFKLKHIS